MPTARVSLSFSEGTAAMSSETQRHLGFCAVSLAAAFVLGAVFTGAGALVTLLIERGRG